MAAEQKQDEFRALRDELDKLREDIAALTQDLRSLGRAAAGSARRAAEGEGERLKADFDEALADLQRRGEKVLRDAKTRVEERPLLTLLIAAAIGFIVGRLLDRR